jgi:chromate transporter
MAGTTTVAGSPDVRPPDLTLTALFLRFLRFGFQAFGGPVAQIAMVRQALVEEERWVEPARFNRLLAVMQVLPGPEAHELCVHLGMVARGRLGGLLAGLGFMLPGFVLMMLCGWAYVSFVSGQGEFASALLGVQVAILAVIVRAVHRIGGHILADMPLLLIALAALIGTLLQVPFWVPLVSAGLAALLPARAGARPLFVAAAIALAWFALPAFGSATTVTAPVAHAAAGLVALFVAGLKGGLLTFGGAYTAIPYVRADTVGRGWLSDGTFLDGVALAGVLPAPLVIFATFAGYVAGGPWGAVAITAGMFLPAFAFSLVLYERLERLVEHKALHLLLDHVAAAVVGVIAATALQLGYETAQRVPSMWIAAAIFAVALFAAWRWKSRWLAPATVAFGAAAGAMLLG